MTKEMIYLAVSIANACSYCVHSHTAAGLQAVQVRSPDDVAAALQSLGRARPPAQDWAQPQQRRHA